MSRTFEHMMDVVAELSGCDWDFVVEMYNCLADKCEVDIDRFTRGAMKRHWNARGVREFRDGKWYGGRFEDVLRDLSDRSGYDYEFLLDRLTDMVYDLDDDGDWDYFVGVTMEHDW